MPPAGAALALLGLPLLALALSPSWDPAPDPAAIVPAGPSARFTVLSPALLRLQHAGGGAPAAFDDRATAVIVNRRLPVPPFSVARPTPTSLVVTTALLRLTYDWSLPPPAPNASASCGYPRAGWGVVGGIALPSAPYGLNGTSQGACCGACSADAQCVAWVYAPANATCALFVQAPTVAPAAGGVLGGPWAPFDPAALRIELLAAPGGGSGGGPTWTPGAVDTANLNGTYQKAECYAGPQACYDYYQGMRGPGLVSRAGWYLHDDTRTLRTAPAPLPSAPGTAVPWLAPPAPGQAQAADWYFFGHGHDYTGALAD